LDAAPDGLGINNNSYVEITIWDNASTDGTRTWLKYLEHDLIDEIILSDENVGLAKPMNYMFKKYKDRDFVVKVDNDTVLPPFWLDQLKMGYFYMEHNHKNTSVGAISGWCLRPWGMQTDEWYNGMRTIEFPNDIKLKENSYICGTGVLINMNMIRERGLLFEGEPCLLGGWTSYCRIANDFDKWRFYFHMDVPLRLLNIRSNHVLSNDFPEYDLEMKKVRAEGDAWWTGMGGLANIKKFVEGNGGYKPLQ
jgi:glycosyltransferase involved in cell wall biosynthesis